MGIRQDQCNKVCRIIDDYLANRPRERDELIVAVRTVFEEADRKTEPQISPADCATCKHDLWNTPRTCGKCTRQEDGKPSMYEPKDEPQTDCSWKKGE